MALSNILKTRCPTCDKIAVEKSVINLGTSKMITLECGHIMMSNSMSKSQIEITSTDGRKPMPFQYTGIRFAEEANARCLIADEQGLGKTVQAAGLLALHLKELSPCIYVTKTRVKVQAMREMMRWTRSKKVQAIFTSKEIAIPGFDIIVTTYDMLKNPEVFELIEPKTLILDECQQVKNHTSGRAKAVQKMVQRYKIEHIIGLSGTPIKNNAGEYFTILNLLDPIRFPSWQRFVDYYCDSYNNGWGTKVGGLKKPDEFHTATKDIIIRRTKKEVLPDLPEKTRNFEYVEMDASLNKSYAAAMNDLLEIMDDNSFEANSNKIAIMTRMREIVGIGKVDSCVDFVTDFLLSSTDRKLVIFVHHHSVQGLLEKKLNDWLNDGNFPPCLLLTSSSHNDIAEQFKSGPNRILIASTLAAGEGLNLQFCSDAIMLERQWNPANEEQAEDRFHRYGQENKVEVTYMIGAGTIDDFFTELVEQKRAIMSSTLDNKAIQWDQQSLMSELALALATRGKSRWSL
jgi:SWI/SNF-related matrix-associated actin-dependent regulator 1 of chromatin subfamily A